MASAFYYNFTKIQLSANSAASADDDLQADMNATLLDFFKTRIDDSTQFNVPLTTTKQVEENIKRIGETKLRVWMVLGLKSLNWPCWRFLLKLS